MNIKDKIVNFESKLLTLGLFLDLRKAFDSVQHDILIRKLETYGVRGVARRLIKSSLSNGEHFVCVNKVTSIRMKVQQEVPQGSVLGPLCFVVYINDITIIPDSPDLIMYADGTNVSLQVHTQKSS